MIIRKLEALFGFRIDTAQFNRATSAIDNFAENANAAMATLAGHFAITTIRDFVNSTTEAMANIGRTAEYLGISTNALEELRYAAEKSGVSLDTLDDSLKELQIRANDAKSGTGEAAEAFQALGLKTTDVTGRMREPLELLDEVADKLNKLPTQSERIWVVDSMFGDQGAEMLKMLKGGSAGLATMREEARKLGYTLDQNSIDAAIKFRQALIALKAVLSGMVRGITKGLLPAMTSFAEGSTALWANLAPRFANLNDNTTALRTAFIALGLVLSGLAIKVLIAFAPMLAIGAAIAVVALIIDDLWAAFSGGESVTRTVLDAIMARFLSLKTWVLQSLSNLWDFLPADLQKNLKGALGLAKDFVHLFAASFVMALKKLMGFATDIFSSIFSVLKNVMGQIYSFIAKVISTIGPILAGMLVDNFSEAVTRIKDAILGIKDLISNITPDFVKKGFSAAVEYVGDIGSQYIQQPSQGHLAPQIASPVIQNHSNQSVSVAVNVKTGASAQEIGSDVSKALRQELEKERLNAFMGVNRYAF